MKRIIVLIIVLSGFVAFGQVDITNLKTNASGICGQSVDFTGGVVKVGGKTVTAAAIEGTATPDSGITYFNTAITQQLNWARVNKTGSVATDVGAIPSTYIDTDSDFVANSDSKIPTQKAVKNALATKSAVAGSSSIVTVGTITSGTWNGAGIDLAHGGTGAATASAAKTALGIRCGTSSAMTAGRVVVLDAATTADTKIVVTPKLQVDAVPMGSLGVDSQTAGWGFEIISSSGTDTCTANWTAIEP